MDDCGIKEIFNEKIRKGNLPEGKENSNWIYRKYNRYLDDKEPVYISLGFNMDDSKNHWSEVRISVIEEKICIVRHKARGNIYNYYPIEDGKLEESIEKAIRHPIKWNRSF